MEKQRKAQLRGKGGSEYCAALSDCFATHKGFVFFWRPQDKNGFMGNWDLKHPTTDADGVHYISNETYMMYKKAQLMGDEATAALILKATDPKNVKKLGRAVKPWKEELWLEHRCRIMYEGLMLKFTQHEDIQKLLLDTGDKILVEASPYDSIWGIKFKSDNPAARKPKQWKGLNLLGRCLMKVRDDIRKSQEEKKSEETN